MLENKIFKLYPKAVDDIESIYQYSLKTFGNAKAESYVKEMESAFQKITINLNISRKCDYIRPNLRAKNVESHVIFFKKTQYGIAIIRVLHKSMDFMQHF